MQDEHDAVELATELTMAWLANPNTRTNADDVPAFLQQMHAAVTALASPTPEEEPAQEYTGAVTARKSLASPDHIISMIDGKPYKTLKRHQTVADLQSLRIGRDPSRSRLYKDMVDRAIAAAPFRRRGATEFASQSR